MSLGPRSFVALLAATLAGCTLIPEPRLDPTRFYVLSPPGEDALAAAPASAPLRVNLRALQLPDYLRDRALMARHGENEVRVLDTARWAEPLEAGLSRVLELRLTAAFDPPADPAALADEATVTVRIVHCEGGYESTEQPVVLFAAVYEIEHTRGSTTTRQRHVFTAPRAGWDASDPATLARALSAASSTLADEIVRHLQTAP